VRHITHREPTAEECTAKARVIAFETLDGIKRYGYACWYPQMGGYGGRCVVVFDEPQGPNDCFDAYVWHDGEFPFGPDTEDNPREIHHCAAEQFVRFGEAVAAMQEKHCGPVVS
jgi:hypothetical protein